MAAAPASILPRSRRRVAPPRLVLTIGLHGSASTWSYNVARELMMVAFGADSIAACFANTLDDLLADPRLPGRRVVCKTHGFPHFATFAELAQARIVATMRDPRDAVLSLMERFATTPEAAVRAIVQDCQYVAWCAAAGHLLLRYEDGFFDAPQAVRRVAAHLGLRAPAAELARVAAAYRTDAVRGFAAAVADLPAERVVRQGRVFLFDRVTQIHGRHIGDARVGKWRERFAAPLQAELSRVFAPFLTRFGYPDS